MKSSCLWALLALAMAARPAAALERWFYVSENLQVDQNVTNLIALMQLASQEGYTHVLLSDSKFCHLSSEPSWYFDNVNAVKQAATNLNLEIVPAVFPVGYANDLLFNNPNLIEGLPVTNSLIVVSNRLGYLQPTPAVSLPSFSNLGAWSWYDDIVVEDNGTARVTNPNGANARVVKTIAVSPFHEYHITVGIKTSSFLTTPNVEVLANGRALNYPDLAVAQTQDWTNYDIVFNSLSNSEVSIYFGVWGGTTGSLWWTNATVSETAFMNLIRRPGAPLTIQTESGTSLIEGKDFAALTDPLMGTVPYNGVYDIYHTPPQLQLLSTNLTNGTRLLASWYHAITVYDGQAAICLSELATQALLLSQAQQMQALWGTRAYFMSHDEIRVMNWCAACQARHLDAGPLLANNVQMCAAILRQVNPGGRIYVWSDMFDPNQNAVPNYYLVRGNLTGSWLGLDRDIIIVPWDYGTMSASLQFFAGLGNRQMIAGYYDSSPNLVTNWLNAAAPYAGITGVMYTTWVPNYSDLGTFIQYVTNYPAPNIWYAPRLLAGASASQPQLILEGQRGYNYKVQQSSDLVNWITWTNFTASDATVNLSPPNVGAAQFYRAAYVP
jgi:hypothetical protein